MMYTILTFNFPALNSVLMAVIIGLLAYIISTLIFHKKLWFRIPESAEVVRARNIMNSMKFSPNAYVVTNSEKGIIWANEKACKVFGEEKELYAKRISDLIFPDDTHDFDAFEKQSRNSTYEHHLELRTVDRYGVPFDSDLISGKWYDEIHKNNYYTFILRDISHRKATEVQYRNVFEKIKVDVDLLSKGEELLEAGTWHWDIILDEVVYSAGFAKIWQLPLHGKLKAIDLLEMIHQDDVQIVNDAMNNHKPYDIEFRLVRKNNEVYLLRSIGSPVLDELNTMVVLYGTNTVIKKDYDN